MNNNQRIGSTQIKELSISESKLASGAVSTNKIQNLAVTTAKLANECIVESKIYQNAVTNSKLHWNTGLFYSTYDYTVSPVLKFADISLTVRQGKDGYPLMHFKNGVGLANRNYLAKVTAVTETSDVISWVCSVTDSDGESTDSYFYFEYQENHTAPYHVPAIGGLVTCTNGEYFTGIITYVYNYGYGHYIIEGQVSDYSDYIYTINQIEYELTKYIYTFTVDTDLTSVLNSGDILLFGELEAVVNDISSTEIEVVTASPIDDYDSISFIEKRDGTFSLLSQRFVYSNGGYTEQTVLDIERTGGKEYARYFKDRDIGHIFGSSVTIGSPTPNINYKLAVVGATLLSGTLQMDGVISGASVISTESLTTSKSINGLQLGSHGFDYPGTGTWLVIAKFRLSGAYHFANFIGDYMSDARYIGIRLSFTISMGCEATFGRGLSFCNVMYEGVGWPTPNISNYFRVVVTEDTSSGTTFQIQVYRGMWLSGKWSIKNDTRNGGSLTIYNTATVGDAPITSSCPIYYRNKRFEGNIGIGKNPGSYSLDTISNINAPGYFRSGINLDSIYSAIAHNHDSTYLKLIGGTITGNIVSPDANRNVSTIGTYDSTKTQQIWAMGAGYLNSVDGSTFGALYGLAYKHTNNGTGGTMASGHMVAWCQGGTPTAALGTNIWTSGQFISTVTTGTSPLSVASTTLVTNLNADLLDGLHESQFARWYYMTCVDGSNLSYRATVPSPSRSTNPIPTAYANAFATEFKLSSDIGLPTGVTYSGLMTFAPWRGETSSGGNQNYQIGFNAASGVALAIPSLYLRSGLDTTWTPWYKLWHEGNDGASSGLDADLLDGNHASSFATSTHTHTVTRKITVLGADLPTENTTLTIPDGATYVMGANKLEVYVNGVYMYQGHDYNEYSTTAITFFSKLPAGTKIMYRIEQ